ncbi:N-acetylmuramoyl-L-alanine amidase [Luteibacter sp. SG786]|uniref:N-acetylmuramoyl-L-alanine amidase family protein n=1 Tax=Luteibacter sp. SG786 TaxID=2587130 RepID=UPI0014243D10|nr:N-acetylmuramoyl-L-alanine amidase [Luteibacter sp. SG786]NII52792.1 N-acetylmuramoyl-L-alanine amidase [Luteibacter sp. SG786]
MLTAAYTCTPQASAQELPKKTIVEMTEDERANLVREMQRAVDNAIIGAHFFSEDPLPIHVEVSVDPMTNLVLLNVDERLGPDALTSEFDDFAAHLSSALWGLMERIDGVTGIDFRFGGFDADHWPINRRPEASARSQRRRRNVERKPLVVLSPGHGLYFHHKYKDWRAQREPANGILEDDITPVLSGHLLWELQRDNVDVKTLRYQGDRLSHKPSGEAWWRLAARYHLERSDADLTDIWQSQGKDSPLKERNEDIRSRPLFANHMKADALLHIHTNADASSAANGLRTYIHGRPEDHELASKVLCSARELIRTDDDFKSFSVSPVPHVASWHAENKLAQMPSVIVEVGFHTSPKDAEFLKKREFQVLAMRGVAKGYRLYRNKLPCEEFAINPTQQVQGQINRDTRMPFSFKGNPRFPVRVWSTRLDCTGIGCQEREYELSRQEDIGRLQIKYMCRSIQSSRIPNDEGAVIELQVKARDSDRVYAKPALYRVACPKKNQIETGRH